MIHLIDCIVESMGEIVHNSLKVDSRCEFINHHMSSLKMMFPNMIFYCPYPDRADKLIQSMKRRLEEAKEAEAEDAEEAMNITIDDHELLCIMMIVFKLEGMRNKTHLFFECLHACAGFGTSYPLHCARMAEGERIILCKLDYNPYLGSGLLSQPEPEPEPTLESPRTVMTSLWSSSPSSSSLSPPPSSPPSSPSPPPSPTSAEVSKYVGWDLYRLL